MDQTGRLHDYGPTLRAWRRQHNNMTVAALAKRMGEAPSTIGNFESGLRYLTPKQALRAEEICGLPLETLGGPAAVALGEQYKARGGWEG